MAENEAQPRRNRPLVFRKVPEWEEVTDLLSNPKAMKALRAAKAGKLTYRELNLDDENFGL